MNPDWRSLTANQLVSYVLMSAYLYYVVGESVWDDFTYDKACKELRKNFDRVTHPHKYLLHENFEDSLFGTKFPNIVKSSAIEWLIENK